MPSVRASDNPTEIIELFSLKYNEVVQAKWNKMLAKYYYLIQKPVISIVFALDGFMSCHSLLD
jgi:hypothetical protein